MHFIMLPVCYIGSHTYYLFITIISNVYHLTFVCTVDIDETMKQIEKS